VVWVRGHTQHIPWQQCVLLLLLLKIKLCKAQVLLQAVQSPPLTHGSSNTNIT
jgi:hypothetical protein